MKHLAYTLSVLGFVGSFGGAAFATDADSATMTCGDFVAMGSEEQETVLDGVNTPPAESR
jgi:hypothetical protein